MADDLATLAPFSWRSIEFPTTRSSISLAHDLVEHKYWGRDGADVEATGRAPLRIRANIPFINGVIPGRGEKWPQGELYPFQYEKFVKAFADRSADVLEHPEHGSIFCRPSTMNVDWEGNGTRNGVFVDAEWIETFELEQGTNGFTAREVESIGSLAESLEAQKRDVASLLPPEEQDDFWSVILSSDFTDVANAISSIGGTAGKEIYRLNGKLSSLEYQTNRIIRSLDLANNPLTWPARQSCERMREAVQKKRDHNTVGARRVLWHTTKRTLTLAAVSVEIPGAKVGDLLRLNPRLASSPMIAAGTVVRYFAP